MYLNQLHLTQFRNYTELNQRFEPGINCLVGPNGVGKTNILDAIHYLAFTRGFRSNQDKHATQRGTQFFFSGAEFEDASKPLTVHCNFVKGKGKKLLINQKPLEKMSSHIGRIPLVAILPNDTELINGPAQGRRKFLDMLISQYDSRYLQHLIQYDRILKQRNALLKLFAEQQRFDVEQIELWDTQLIPHGIKIHQGRTDFLKAFRPQFRAFFKQIVAQHESPEIRYRSSVKTNDIPGWLNLMEVNRDRDRHNHYTGSGVHRDDLDFVINGQSVRNFGSQGQQKTFIIALKFAQYRLLHEQTGRWPILLLDDIFDKLDEHRLGSIAHILDRDFEGQIFITDTSQERLARVFDDATETAVHYYQVSPGAVQSTETDE